VKVKGLRRKKKDAPKETESVQKRVLKLLADAGDTGYPLEDLSDLLGIVEPKLEPYLDVLKEQAYINIAVEVGRPPEYKIAAKGEQYLDESKPT
jgi:DNA-binding PadR family transcriptional regulator